MFKNKITLILILISVSCNSQNIYIELNNCVNEKINENHYYSESNEFDFYKFILEVEDLLIKNNLLREVKKKNYKNLLFKIIDGNESFSKINKKIGELFDKNNYHLYSTDIIFNQCPYLISRSGTGKVYEKLYSKGKILNEVMKSGYNNKKNICKLFNNYTQNDFTIIEYRAPLILLVAININLAEKTR